MILKHSNRKRLLSAAIKLAAFCWLVTFTAEADARATYTIIDAPGASRAPNSGTWAVGLSKKGFIAGRYKDDQIGYIHGFVRAPDGAIESFDAPKAYETWVTAINVHSVIVGSCLRLPENNSHAYARAADGHFTVFDAPGATDTSASGINASGTIVGTFLGPVGWAGFVRAKDGTFTTFNIAGSTYPTSINDAGVIGGVYGDPNNVPHGFVRAVDGTITAFDPPTAFYQREFLQISVAGIDANGNVAGLYVAGSDGTKIHAFLRLTDGTFAAVEPKGSYSSGIFGMDSRGTITGFAVDPRDYVFRGFIRSLDGHTKIFEVPDARYTSGYDVDGSAIVGSYYDQNNVVHGFLRSRGTAH